VLEVGGGGEMKDRAEGKKEKRIAEGPWTFKTGQVGRQPLRRRKGRVVRKVGRG
jgi:hypothetical protein